MSKEKPSEHISESVGGVTLLNEAVSTDLIKDTIANKNIVKLDYRGKIPGGPGQRVVEPVCLGYSKDNKLVLRVWDTQGASHTAAIGKKGLPGWRLLRVDKISYYSLTNKNFTTPRPNFNPLGDRSMNKVILNAKFEKPSAFSKAGRYLSKLKNKILGREPEEGEEGQVTETVQLKDLLNELFDTPARGAMLSKERIVEPYTLILYRGFDADLSKLEKVNGSFVLSPKKSEQGILWFTHKFIRGHEPIEYAAAHGSLFLSYPLTVQKHYDLVTYENGDVVKQAPTDILETMDETENQPFMCLYNEFCLELPEGWIFTYKNEKFIGTTNKLLVDPDMIQQN